MDDGTFIGTRTSLYELLSFFTGFDPNFGQHINLCKCELYWPSGDSSLPDFLQLLRMSILTKVVWSYWVHLFGTLLSFHYLFIHTQLDKISAIRDKLADLEDPQVELHLLRSCVNVCEITHILRCVPFSSLGCFPSLFDEKLCTCLSRVIHCSLSNDAWF